MYFINPRWEMRANHILSVMTPSSITHTCICGYTTALLNTDWITPLPFIVFQINEANINNNGQIKLSTGCLLDKANIGGGGILGYIYFIFRVSGDVRCAFHFLALSERSSGASAGQQSAAEPQHQAPLDVCAGQHHPQGGADGHHHPSAR